VDSGKTTADDVVKIGDVNVVVKEASRGPMIFGQSVKSNAQKSVLANDHKASSNSSTSKYHQSRWCVSGLSHSKKEDCSGCGVKSREAEKLRNEHFNKYRPMVARVVAY